MDPLTADDFDRLFRQTNKKLTDYARSLLNNSSKRLPTHSSWDAEDAVSEAWVKALTADWTDTRTPEALLITFVKFAALAVIRDAQPIVDLDYDRGETEYRLLDSGYPGLEDPETHAAWAEVLPLLSEKQAVCVWMICIGGYTRDEVARLLGGPKYFVDNGCNEGLRKIQRYFREGYRFTGRACGECGWPRASIGHRTTCHPKPRVRRRGQAEQQERNINSKKRWPDQNSAGNGGTPQ